ncbi:esterase-like activity of phytase family protein [Tenacibaculum salmonis]|uniref:esterase-like activity of phytase family protein n=1 Tax=Tenacibaculum sp. P3-BQ1 TaxID=3232310 RepID=UPI0034E046D9
MKIRFIYIAVFLVLSGCKTEKISLKFLNEFVVKDSLILNNTIIGGVSGIDFSNNQYFMVVDDARNPRVLVGDILIKENAIKEVTFKKVIQLDTVSSFCQSNFLDLEGIFIADNQINLISEGSIRKGKSPTIFIIDSLGKYQKEIKTPVYFNANSVSQPKHNATFESSSKSSDKKGFWVGMEAPLKADGEEPTFHKTQSPIRITYFDNQSKKATKQFVYQLEKINKPAKGNINLNGVTAILEYKKNNFFVIERIYQSGYGTLGNTIRIFKASIDKTSTNTLDILSLKKEKYIPLKKELLFDFSSIQHKLTDSIIDNIEGITFGPKLLNGNRSLILVSDDNFQAYGKQLTQFLLLEIETE